MNQGHTQFVLGRMHEFVIGVQIELYMTDKEYTPASMKKLKVAFIHPDLGIGGAERLICCSRIK